MSETTTTLMAATYPNEEHARTILDMLESMYRALTIDLKDAVMVTKEDDGKIKVHETTDVSTRKGLKRGAIAGGVLGLIFPPSLLITAAAGGGIGALWGKIKDSGVKHDDVKNLADKLAPGQAALIVLVDNGSVVATQLALGSYEGELVTKPVSDAELKELYERQGREWTSE
ncbi:MAG TPA: DUF1269 domain-containing protein [Thermomicrobiales bacterium]|nr:DUF1269 domain-containing protein [Thermomicrobiales bacterium]